MGQPTEPYYRKTRNIFKYNPVPLDTKSKRYYSFFCVGCMSSTGGDTEVGDLKTKGISMRTLKSILFVSAVVLYIGFFFAYGAKDELLEKAEGIRTVIQTEVR